MSNEKDRKEKHDNVSNKKDRKEKHDMARVTPQQQRERALMGAISRCAAERELDTDAEVAGFLGMDTHSYSRYRRMKFQTRGFLLFCKIARQLGLTGREVCAAVGVPYEEEK